MPGTADDPPADTLTLRLLGTPQWQRDGAPPRPLAARDAALLALLAVDGGVARDRAAAWLWPDATSQAHANLSLRQRLFRLRRECGHPLVEAAATLALAPGIEVDLHAQPLPADGTLLAGLDFGAYEAFDAWLAAARLAIGQRQADALAGEAARLEERGALAEAAALAERIVAAWPATERAWRQLMRLHWQRADRAAAIAAFERFEQQVCREWGLRPSAETLALLATIERDEAARPAPRAGLPPGLLHPPVLVGRDAALQALDSAWRDGRAVLLRAAGGMGKSRLLDAAIAGRPGVLRARARPGDDARPYATLVHALDDALTRFAPVLDAATHAELARLLPRLGPPPAAPARQDALWQAVAAAWAAAERAGLQALVWDDLHWADTATLELLRWQLAHPSLSSLRQAFAARPDEPTPAAAALADWLGDSLRVQPLALSPWQPDELRALLPTLGLPASLGEPGALAAVLHRQTGGQPFFVLETLKTLVLAAGAGAAPAPAPAVAAMIERRAGRLADAPRRLLQLLAVAAAPLPLPVAAAVLARPLVDLADDWSALADAQLVRDDGLAHDLVREAVLQALPRPAARALHLALARAMASQPGADPARLAAHWSAAEAPAEASAAWLLAAAGAVRTGRLAEAQRLFDHAVAAADAAGDDALRIAARAAAQPTRLLREGPDAVAAALAPLRDAVHAAAPRARLLLLLAEAEMSRMRADAADAAAAEALALCDDSDDSDDSGAPSDDRPGHDPALLADATLMQARTLAWTGRSEAGVTLLHAACERAEADGDLRRRLQAQATLADVLVADGRRVESAAVQQRTLALARRLGDRFETAVAASNLAVYALLVGDAAGAWTASRQALAEFDAMGVEHVNRLMCAGVHAMAAAHHGRFDLAWTAAAPLLDGPDDPVRRNLRHTMATLALWQGRADEAAALLPPIDDGAPLSVRLTGLFARLRWCARSGADDAAERSALAAIGRAHPALRDDAHYYRAWAAFDDDGDAASRLARLDAMAAREAAAGAGGVARALGVAALQIAWRAGDAPGAAARARALAPVVGHGLHPALLPVEADRALSLALRAGDDAADAALADAADARAAAWIAAARLPDDGAGARAAFEAAHAPRPGG